MKDETLSPAVADLAYLAACAVNGDVPDAGRVAGMDLALLYKTAERHMLTGITAMALESAGVKNEAFTQAKGKAIRKNAVFALELSAVMDALERAGIWHMPLKGAVLKDLYPSLGMRQMSDIDILFDASRSEDVRGIMESLGFSTERGFGRGAHDCYSKPPVTNFEMHRSLLCTGCDERLVDYYRNVKERLIPEEGFCHRFQFSDEDFYLYMIAHEFKHYSGSGTGLRSLLDTWVYLSRKGSTLDREYISSELDKMGIRDFEERNRSLSMRLFTGEALPDADREMLEYLRASGTYGTVGNRVRNRIAVYGDKPGGKLRYAFKRLFLPLSLVRVYYPLFCKIPILLPFLPFYRALRSLLSPKGTIKAELKALREYEKKNDPKA